MADFASVLDQAHQALRGIDAADLSRPIPLKEIDAVCFAVEAVEKFAHDNGIVLSEFRRRAEGRRDDLRDTMIDICRPPTVARP